MSTRWSGKGSGRALACAAGILALEIHCREDRVGWTDSHFEVAHRVYIARSGAYLRRVNGVTSFVDATNILVTRPGDETSIAHPMGRDTGTIVELVSTPAVDRDVHGCRAACRR
jgi:hypothetical protein